ncbi:MAG TPA: hypothetical protein VL972_06970 [Solirubrobacteraceae bacterium]|nr:hypothetical protein [Solirubrobacteraceae bacterium]
MRLVKPEKMTLNAVSLMTATIATNALGLVFWAVAAHVHSANAVGAAFAEISALTLLATLAQLNLTNVFIRFVPKAGRKTMAFVLRGYAVIIGLALVLGAAFVASGVGSGYVHAGLAERLLFVVAAALFAIFALQDSVLTALRITHWVPVENVSFAAAKLALLPLLAFLPARTSIVVAWVLPVAVAVVIVNGLLYRTALGRTRHAQGGELPGRRRLMSFLAAEYSTTLCAAATVQLMPLIVVWRLGTAYAAYFSLPWLVCIGITLLQWNVGASFVVEAVTAGGYTPRLLRRGLQLWGAVVVGAVVVCCFGAALILRLEGPAYAAHGVTLLRLIGASAPFSAVVVLYGAFAWLDQRLWRLVAIQAASGAILLGLSFVLMPRLGLAGVGWANLAAQVAGALLMAPAVYSRLAGRSSRVVVAATEGLS